MGKQTNGQILIDISTSISNLDAGQKAMIVKQEDLEKNVKEMSDKLFDHETGIAIHVHDNTKLRKKIEKEGILNIIYSSQRFVKSSKKHLFTFYTMVLGLIFYGLRGVLF